MDISYCYPLLMVKDFNSIKFSIVEEFMTKADVPIFAMKDIICNPVNPFTGKEIGSSRKAADKQYTLFRWIGI